MQIADAQTQTDMQMCSNTPKHVNKSAHITKAMKSEHSNPKVEIHQEQLMRAVGLRQGQFLAMYAI